MQHFSCVIKFLHIVDAECDHFITFCKIMRDAEMCAACTSTQNEIKVIGKNNKDNSGQVLEPAHLTLKLIDLHAKVNVRMDNLENYSL